MKASRKKIDELIINRLKQNTPAGLPPWNGLNAQAREHIKHIPRKYAVRRAVKRSSALAVIMLALPLAFYYTLGTARKNANTSGAYNWNLTSTVIEGINLIENSVNPSYDYNSEYAANDDDNADDTQNNADTEILAMDSSISDMEYELNQLAQPIWNTL